MHPIWTKFIHFIVEDTIPNKLFPDLAKICIKIKCILADFPLICDYEVDHKRYKLAAFTDVASDSY